MNIFAVPMLAMARGHHSPSNSFSFSRGAKGSLLDASGGLFTGATYFLQSSASSAQQFSGGSSTTTQLLPPASGIPPLKLTNRDEVARVQLQKQWVATHRRSRSSVGENIPGYKTSAVFLNSLRTNLHLQDSPGSSPMSTPPSMVNSATSLPPPSPLSQAVDLAADDADSRPKDLFEGVPELRSYIAEDDEDRIAALKLAADSVAQMRQTSNRILISHPVNMAVVVAVIAMVARYMYDRDHDLSIVATTCAGLVMSFLAICRFLTQEYLHAAETFNWDWLGDADVMVTKFGDEIIGTLIIEWYSGESRQKRKKAWRGEIRAWTVRLRYRHKGVGTALLEDAVKEAKKKGAESIEFAEDHANSKRVLVGFYNSAFNRREAQARDLLQDMMMETSPSRGKKK